MKPMLIRMPEELHARLKARAAAEGRSATAVAVEAIDRELSAVGTTPADRLRAKLARRRPDAQSGRTQPRNRELLRRELPRAIPSLTELLAEDRS